MTGTAPMTGTARAGPGCLFLVPTPIGNVRDTTARAGDVLRAVEVVAAEDTRKARTLLRALDIQARLVSYYDANEVARSAELLRVLQAGGDVALITDAGTPLVSDPGYRIVAAAIENGARVCPLPGPSAAITALVGSGLPPQQFQYVGFLPRKAAARRAAAAALASLPATLIIFEAPHRLRDCLADLTDVLGDRRAALARNLTKPDEEYLRGPLSVIAGELGLRDEVRGEYTLVIAGADGAETAGAAAALADRMARSLLRHAVPPHVVRDVLREVTGLPRNEVYERVQAAQRPEGAGPATPAP
jgi:16S rRNA (cytidine1402-2'-O)-methyltransferase